MERGTPDANLNDEEFSDYTRRVKSLAAISTAASAAANQRSAKTLPAQPWMGSEWGEELESGDDSSSTESDDSMSNNGPSMEGVNVAESSAERGVNSTSTSVAQVMSRPVNGSGASNYAHGLAAKSEAEELFGDNILAPPSFGAPTAVAAAELAAAEASKDELLEELVGLAAALKGEARALNSHLVDQNKDLDKLSTVAELTSTQLGGEVRKLHAHFRRRLVAACGGLGMLMAVVFSFAAAVLFMRFFPRRWSVWSVLPVPFGHEEL
jgi:hypothetical protein